MSQHTAIGSEQALSTPTGDTETGTAIDLAIPSDLTPQQAAFVDAYVANGGQATAAAKAAGYAQGSARVSGNRLLKQDKVLRHIHDRTIAALAAAAPAALNTLERLARSAKSERVRREAASDLLDRVGMRAPERREILHGGSVSLTIDLT